MGKGFNIPTILGASLTDLLHDALESLSPPHPIRIMALLNDAVATLLSHAFIRPTTRMGLICGTGTNATALCPTTYLSEEKYHHEGAWEEFVLVNTEWSMFGKDVLPVTQYDKIVDRQSGMPGFQPFEMMVSGRYIGEIVRLVALDGLEKGAWSFDEVPSEWDTRYALQTATCSSIEAYVSLAMFSDNSNGDDLQKTVNLLNKLHPLSCGSYTPSDAVLLRQICNAISIRSASLVASSTIALLQVNNELETTSDWNSSSSAGTPSPSDSGLGMDDDVRWSRRGSLFSAQGSRRGSLASPSLLSVQTKSTAPSEDENEALKVPYTNLDSPTDLHLDSNEVVVAYCGSVMEKYHLFKARCQDILDELVQMPCPHLPNADDIPRLRTASQQRRVVLEENCDGGILGAGILAAVVDTKFVN
jgi:hexokinase